MKRILLVKVIFLLAILELLSHEFFEQFELRRLTANFYGSCINENTL